MRTYTTDQTKSDLLDLADLGKGWTKNELRVSSFQDGDLRGCSLSDIRLPGSPEKTTRKYGAPDYKLRGANYAQFIAVYPTSDQAADAISKVQQEISKCPGKKKVPAERLPGNKLRYQHEDTWKLTESEIEGWRHLRGFEKTVYPPSISNINVYYTVIDYAQSGNAVFSSLYWQRVTPKDSGEPIAEKATELLTEQLKRFG
ncbi:hypothetical protein [Actinocorallia populi]|uniref:hypothetical protein n=1 Tax=Actinocorallia populi TaxID=2079200 RepID=UPI00130050D4|nr:hypothetical protein [Actinocorallia populi]